MTHQGRYSYLAITPHATPWTVRLHPEAVATEALGWPPGFRPQEIIFLFIWFPAMWWLPPLPTHMHTMACACCPGCSTEQTKDVFTPICHRNLTNLSCTVGKDSKCLSALWEGCTNDHFLSLVILSYFRTNCWPPVKKLSTQSFSKWSVRQLRERNICSLHPHSNLKGGSLS